MLRNLKGKPQREPHHKKLVKKGVKSSRNQPELYSEPKNNSTFSLTPFAKNRLNQCGKKIGLSMSEYLERLLRWTDDPTSEDAFAHAQEFISRGLSSDPEIDKSVTS